VLYKHGHTSFGGHARAAQVRPLRMGLSGDCPTCQRAAISGDLSSVAHSGLTIGPPGDEYEREADRVADAVMEPPTSAGGPPGSGPAALPFSPNARFAKRRRSRRARRPAANSRASPRRN
jgi:hypothetical protein